MTNKQEIKPRIWKYKICHCRNKDGDIKQLSDVFKKIYGITNWQQCDKIDRELLYNGFVYGYYIETLGEVRAKEVMKSLCYEFVG